MKRALLIASLAFGTVAGFTSGLHHLARTCHRNDPPPTASSPACPDHLPATSGPE